MGVVRVPAPYTTDAPEEVNTFRTYLSYLRSISGLVREHAAAPQDLVAFCQRHPGFGRISRKPGADKQRVERLLRIAWGTEIALGSAEALDSEDVHYANLWAPIQTYYAAYLALQALFAAAMKPDARDHSKTLSVVAEDIRVGCLISPPPWSVLCTSLSPDWSASLAALPVGVRIRPVNAQSMPTSERRWSFLAMALRTTRLRDVKDHAIEWRRGKKTRTGTQTKQTPRGVRDEIARSLPPTSLFSFLYRLRIRSNYRDADMILEGPGSSSEGLEFNECLRFIVDRTLLVIELNIAARIGPQALKEMGGRFLGRRPGPRTRSPLRSRLEVLP